MLYYTWTWDGITVSTLNSFVAVHVMVVMSYKLSRCVFPEFSFLLKPCNGSSKIIQSPNWLSTFLLITRTSYVLRLQYSVREMNCFFVSLYLVFNYFYSICFALIIYFIISNNRYYV